MLHLCWERHHAWVMPGENLISPQLGYLHNISLFHALLGRFNPGIMVECVEGKRIVHQLADMFVDDKDIWTGPNSEKPCNNEIPDLMKNFRKAVQAWDFLLFCLRRTSCTPQVLLVADFMEVGQGSVGHANLR